MAETWDEENWFDLADYSNLDMDACIRAMEENRMSSSSSFAGSPPAEVSEVDWMEEDSPLPSVALPEGSVVLTSSEHPNTSTSPVTPTGKTGDEALTLRSEGQCTLDTVMGDQYSPTASTYSGGQPTSGEGVNKVTTGRRLGGNDKTQHTVGNLSD